MTLSRFLFISLLPLSVSLFVFPSSFSTSLYPTLSFLLLSPSLFLWLLLFFSLSLSLLFSFPTSNPLSNIVSELWHSALNLLTTNSFSAISYRLWCHICISCDHKWRHLYSRWWRRTRGVNQYSNICLWTLFDSTDYIRCQVIDRLGLNCLNKNI